MSNVSQYGVRRFGRVNWLGLWTLIRRENMRYLAIWQQTIFAPLITAALFLLVFSIAIGPGRADVFVDDDGDTKFFCQYLILYAFRESHGVNC